MDYNTLVYESSAFCMILKLNAHQMLCTCTIDLILYHEFQIESHVKWLESLREEKHRLFQQLKLVLHEEDERKRLKVEQKV